MRSGFLLAAVAMAGGASGARPAELHDKVLTGPVPAWVTPVAPPDKLPDGAGQPVQLVLQDEQFDLRPRLISRYSEQVIRIAGAAGLAAGNLGFAWNPETQTVTVHKLVIHRGAQTIDVLAAQHFTVVRREQNLENASLDGILTATLQPEGLQVGDTLDFVISITTAEPTMGDHMEAVGAGWNGVPIARAHLSAQWPSGVLMHLRGSGDLVVPTPVKAGALTRIEIARDAVSPIPAPSGAPKRYQYGRLLEMSDQASWNGIAGLYAPLYARAAQLGPASPLTAEVERIKAASPDAVTRAEAALALVQDHVRYVFHGMNDGGMVPDAADSVWAKRFGDCKGKTVLLLALLHQLGVAAEPVAVNASAGDGLDQRLPMIDLFDHVLVHATIGGRSYWLDGTRSGDRHLANLRTPDFSWGLPLVADAHALVAIRPAALQTPDTDIMLTLDASKGVDAPVPAHAERYLRGDEAIGTNLALSAIAPEQRDQTLRQFWKGKYDAITPDKVSYSFDPERAELHLVMDGTARMDWDDSGFYELEGVWVGYKPDFTRDPAADKTAPYAVGFPYFIRTVDKVILPDSGRGFQLYQPGDAEVDATVAGMHWHRTAKLADGVLTVEEDERALAPEFPARDTAAAEPQLRALFKRGVYLQKPSGPVTVRAAVNLLTTTPADGPGFLRRGYAFLTGNQPDKALADFDEAVALSPKDPQALLGRHFAHVALNRADEASRDLAAAAALAPDNAYVLSAQASDAERRGEDREALGFATRLLAAEPANLAGLTTRAEANHRLGADDAALRDIDAAIKVAPSNTEMYRLKGSILRNRGDRAGAIATAQALYTANPRDDFAYVTAARVLASVNERERAMAAFDQAIKLKPDAYYIYLNRANSRAYDDRAGRRVDLEKALQLAPTDAETLEDMARFQRQEHDWGGMAATLTRALAADPKRIDLLIDRAAAFLATGRRAEAAADLAAAHALALTPEQLNTSCWEKATLGIDLQTALADCDASLVKQPDSFETLDSRALTLLRLGRTADALAAYDRALAKGAGNDTLYARALAENRAGRTEAADRDRATALKIDPSAADRYTGYDMGWPTTTPLASAATH